MASSLDDNTLLEKYVIATNNCLTSLYNTVINYFPSAIEEHCVPAFAFKSIPNSVFKIIPNFVSKNNEKQNLSLSSYEQTEQSNEGSNLNSQASEMSCNHLDFDNPSDLIDIRHLQELSDNQSKLFESTLKEFFPRK